MINKKVNKMVQITLPQDIVCVLDEIIYQTKKDMKVNLTKSDIILTALYTWFEANNVVYNSSANLKK